MRSCEYTAKDNGEYDPKALHWRDAFFRNKVELVTGTEVMSADRLTCSVSSNKNSLLRCTRTIFLTSSPVSAVKLLKQRYLDILMRTGSVPDPNAPVFLLSSGKPISRRDIASTIQNMLESFGVPSQFLARTHSGEEAAACTVQQVCPMLTSPGSDDGPATLTSFTSILRALHWPNGQSSLRSRCRALS